jgi:FKBP-type peptidyl-prolyl cis-trans isomerase SlyD
MADQELRVEDGMVVGMDYTLRADDAEGEVLDTSAERAPLEFLQGSGAIIPGLERELYGMTVGEEKDVTVEPADGYGDFDPEAYTEVPLHSFPDGMAVEPGVGLTVRDESGNTYEAFISEVREDSAVLDFNHPLAGQTLHFNVRISSLRPATEEEQEHGHAHSEGHHHHDQEDDHHA